ncbi:40-kDa huntingtin-associated protein-like [Ischnura elegans]|uniref:40-kDa huntingtin-associated protein-like n=1 Tax=Ischnura elegans TaxID=197161 RepID=UPI001ED88059|nr:40-kDa huntingtin-associated protein-like [Ischnura elegans]
MTDGGGIGDFLGQYRAISSKLKKRFLRNPNAKEASEQFGTLAKNLQSEGQPQYSGYCCLAVARCEQKLGNPCGEVAALVKGARLFLEAEKRNHSLRCPSFDEHLQAAISCYNSAIKLHTESGQGGPAAALCLELGSALEELDRPAEAAEQFAAASCLLRHSPPLCRNALGYLASCKIRLGDYDGALGVFNEMASLAKYGGLSEHSGPGIGSYRDMQCRCEVTRVLLLLVLQPTPQRLSPNLARVLEKYAWAGNEGDDSGAHQTVDFLSQDLFLLLQSLVMACQSHDTDSLPTLEADLWPHLQSAEQRDLLRVLVSRMTQ